jgi:mRNA degradation ribonuclease J1/J2
LQFASNLHRMAAVKKAADASGRRICFIGMSLNFYLEAAAREGRAPFDPKEVISAADMDGYDPNELLIVTTGSQAGGGGVAAMVVKQELSQPRRLSDHGAGSGAG